MRLCAVAPVCRRACVPSRLCAVAPMRLCAVAPVCRRAYAPMRPNPATPENPNRRRGPKNAATGATLFSGRAIRQTPDLPPTTAVLRPLRAAFPNPLHLHAAAPIATEPRHPCPLCYGRCQIAMRRNELCRAKRLKGFGKIRQGRGAKNP
jgi:hypothetical protein